VPKTKLPKKAEVDTARHLQQRVEVGHRREPAEKARQAGTAPPTKHGERVEQNAVAHQVEHPIDILRLGDVLRQIGPLDFAALGSQLFHYGEAITIARRRDHTHPGIDGHLERRLAE